MSSDDPKPKQKQQKVNQAERQADTIRITRTPHNKQQPYFMMARETAQDINLSPEALGILTYLLSQPDGWRVNARDLDRREKCGRDRAYRILRELIDERYIERTRLYDEKGHAQGYIYDVYEKPVPFTENPETDKAYTEIPQTENAHAYIGETLDNTDRTEYEDSAATLSRSANERADENDPLVSYLTYRTNDDRFGTSEQIGESGDTLLKEGMEEKEKSSAKKEKGGWIAAVAFAPPSHVAPSPAAPAERGETPNVTAKRESGASIPLKTPKPKRATQPHMLPLESFVTACGASMIPTGFAYGPLARLSKAYYKANVTPDAMACAGAVYRAWYEGLEVKPVLTWTAADVTIATRLALGICAKGLCAADVTAFMRTTYESRDAKGEQWWKGKHIKLQYVADHLAAPDDKPAAPTKRAHDPACVWCGGTGTASYAENDEGLSVQLKRGQSWMNVPDAERIAYATCECERAR